MNIDAWEIQRKGNLRSIITEAFDAGVLQRTSTVWRGPDGSVFVETANSDIEDYADYSEAGTVSEYLD